ncbi:hypothetical protein [Fervidobacterium gondwanense]|uniref:hypothetical protein n=1 Tax=Fervidobacterium gondwanense TaxID=44754 RepID=UPI003A765144
MKKNRKTNYKNGFMIAIVLVFLSIASVLLLTVYEIIGNYRTNAIRMSVSSQLEVDALNTLNAGIGYMRTKSVGVLGFNIAFQSLIPTWFSDFYGKLSQEWKNFIDTSVVKSSHFTLTDITANSNSSPNDFPVSELTTYFNDRKLSRITISVFRMNTPLKVFIVSRIEKDNQTAYAYGVVTSKLLNQYVYFTNKETSSTYGTIYFKAGELIDGPMRTHDYININNAGGVPTFTSTVEFLGIKNPLGQVVPESQYSNFANLQGNPAYRILNDADISKLDFSSIKNDYKTKLQTLVRDYSAIKSNPTVLSGIKFTGDVIVSFNHGQGGSNYDVKISQGTTDYIITWNPSPPNATLRKQGGGAAEETNILFNGIISTTGNITVDGPTALSTYKGNYTLFAEGDIILKDRIIPYNTYVNKFTANEHGNNGDPVTNTQVHDIKNFVNSNETSFLNLVAISDVRIGQKLDDMKIFASIYAFDGSFQVDSYSSGLPAGQLFVLGSIMQNYRGPVGTFNPSTGQTTTGYYKTYSYDPRILTGAYQPGGTPAKSGTISLKVVGIVH